MKLLIGLGNPDKKYASNRHNVGYLLVNRMWNRGESSLVAKQSNVFMNESGNAVKKLVEHYSLPLGNLYIAHDDLDIKVGDYKIQFGKGPKDHNGINDIEEELGTGEFWRVRIGVDSRVTLSERSESKGNRTSGEKYVLEDFTKDERVVIDKVIDEICKKLATF